MVIIVWYLASETNDINKIWIQHKIDIEAGMSIVEGYVKL